MVAASTEGNNNDDVDGSPECPICLGSLSSTVETNCSHKYCAECILEYWESRPNHPAACQCPYCRREINLLMPVNTVIREFQIQQKINDYNRRMGTAPIPITTQVRETPTLLRHIFNESISGRGLSSYLCMWIIALVVLVVMYFISPIDLIPELVFGRIGYIDDFGSILIALVFITQVYRRDMSRRVL